MEATYRAPQHPKWQALLDAWVSTCYPDVPIQIPLVGLIRRQELKKKKEEECWRKPKLGSVWQKSKALEVSKEAATFPARPSLQQGVGAPVFVWDLRGRTKS